MSVADLLERGRRELLDLTTRNRLLNIPKTGKSARVIHVLDERSSEIHRLLLQEGKSFTFLPARKGGDAASGEAATPLTQPEDDALDERGIAPRHGDTKLQTGLTSEALQKRLLAMYYDARTFIEEQGVNILYLALGHLKWFEQSHSDIARFAPLVLVPAALERRSAAERFHLRWLNEDPAENLSLAAKLKADFGIVMPEFREGDEFDPGRYLAAVAEAVKANAGWEVLPDEITLGFFSFAKFLMYRDLDPANWPVERPIDRLPFVVGLLRDGFPAAEDLIPDDADMDAIVPAGQLVHVADADSSQTRAIEIVRRGRNLVIQGPPGTGKSQTITNLIASAAADGRSVLFVAEKMAALDVVKRRLDAACLGPLCLELHSHKSNKRAVLEEIKRTLALGRPKSTDRDALIERLTALRGVLNGHAAALHARLDPSGLTPFAMLGHLVRLRGVAAAEIRLDGAESWSAADEREREALLRELAARIAEIGVPDRHPWRGVALDALLSIDAERILGRVARVKQQLAESRQVARALADRLQVAEPATLSETTRLAEIGAHVAAAPALDKRALADPVWENDRGALRDTVAAGERLSAARRAVAEQVADLAWTTDMAETRQMLAAYGRSLLRIFHGRYRRAMAKLRSILKGALPKSLEQRLALLDELIAGRLALQQLGQAQAVAARAFGADWHKDSSDWPKLAAVLAWVERLAGFGLAAEFRAAYGGINDHVTLGPSARGLGQRAGAIAAELGGVAKALRLDLDTAFTIPELAQVPLDELAGRVDRWLADPEGLPKWINFFVRAGKAKKLGLTQVVAALECGAVGQEHAIELFERVYYEALLRTAITANPALGRFDGMAHDRLVAEFRDHDRKRMELARLDAAVAHYDRMPRGGGGVGPMGVIMGEIARKRGHMPIRKLLRLAGPALQAIKPVFMMSPLSVAQFLEPGILDFDLLLIDEASQVEPVDALGAVARARQIVVVGDDRQLPPTRFFMRLTSEGHDDEEEDEGIARVGDIESILGLCAARGLPQAMLRWHYRSRHQSLIAVSNREFYDNRLFIVPSPYAAEGDRGLRFHHVADGVFDSGGTAVNRNEARAVAAAVIRHARAHADLSLGVAAFSIKQKDAVLDELELLRRRHPETEGFFVAHPTEPFFVKNLENVQGDERDVIFISVGYGRNASGYMAMRFGPLSAAGGERRLNVLISRAKLRCDVFSSITADDIDLERARARGVAALKTFLAFAQSGRLGVAQATGDEPHSPFEAAVKRALEAEGWRVDAQVGAAGFFVDLAVLHPERPGRYLLGIECDGAAYHSARSARDRDRLRQAVLEDHGWIIHRIWSTDWFQRPRDQLRRALAAIAAAHAAIDAGDGEPSSSAGSGETEIERADDMGEPPALDWANVVPYREAAFAVPREREPHELPTAEMARIVARVVEEEGPIHADEVAQRVRTLWGLQRAGSRIQAAVRAALQTAERSLGLVAEGQFYGKVGAATPIRDRATVGSAGLRRPEFLPPTELRAAIVALIRDHAGAAREEIPAVVARMLGFKSTGPQVRTVIDGQVQDLLRRGQVTEAGGILHLVD